jgi:D-glycero-D-manno-heptose 1,7-bisphosphate phosphatase
MKFTTAFLDRDGTINVKAPEGDYITRPDDVVLLPGAARAVARLNARDVLAVLVSNQRGIARALFTHRDLDLVTDRLMQLLAEEGARLDGVYICAHDEGECDCRKPLPGMLLRAARENPNIDLGAAVMVGDAESDVAAGIAAGVTTIRLNSGEETSRADYAADDLADAVDWILAQ